LVQFFVASGLLSVLIISFILGEHFLSSVLLLPGLVRAGSTNQKAAMFEKEINDQKKATEKPQKKTVWGTT
jgi:hypothetical protein